MARSGHIANAFAALRQCVRAVFQTGERRPLRNRHRLDAGGFDEVLRMLERDAWLKDKMLDELREAERVGEGTVLRRTSQVDFAELVRSTAESLAPVARTKHVTVRVRCAATSVLIPSDAKDLTHVVGHVLACAIAASAPQSTVDCQLSVDAHWVRLLVRAPINDGGLAGLSHVLDSSDQATSERAAADWDHLGLTTVRTLIDLHGGNVRVQILNLDVIFTVTLPGDRPVPGSRSEVTSQNLEGQ